MHSAWCFCIVAQGTAQGTALDLRQAVWLPKLSFLGMQWNLKGLWNNLKFVFQRHFLIQFVIELSFHVLHCACTRPRAKVRGPVGTWLAMSQNLWAAALLTNQIWAEFPRLSLYAILNEQFFSKFFLQFDSQFGFVSFPAALVSVCWMSCTSGEH